MAGAQVCGFLLSFHTAQAYLLVSTLGPSSPVPSPAKLRPPKAKGGTLLPAARPFSACPHAARGRFYELGCLGLQCHTAPGDELHWRNGERALALTLWQNSVLTLGHSMSDSSARLARAQERAGGTRAAWGAAGTRPCLARPPGWPRRASGAARRRRCRRCVRGGGENKKRRGARRERPPTRSTNPPACQLDRRGGWARRRRRGSRGGRRSAA